jgi:hypothetical protein
MSSTLPSFSAVPQSPPLGAAPSDITVTVERMSPRAHVVHGAYRVASADRATLGRDPVRHQVWLVLIDRATLACWAGRPGAGAAMFEGEEPAGRNVEGFFSVDLSECVGLEARAAGVYDLIAVLGPYKSPAVAISIGK